MTREQQIMDIAAQYAINETDGQNGGKAASKRGLLLSAFRNGAQWADSHPHWIPVEEELPKEKGMYMFRLSNGDMCYETYYPKLKLVANVTHWMEIVPPRKEG
jgi:hypothetical protein